MKQKRKIKCVLDRTVLLIITAAFLLLLLCLNLAVTNNIVWAANSGRSTSSMAQNDDEATTRSSYPWNDMNLTKKASCGVDKCFFRSLRDETVGYLVAGGGQFEYLEEAYNLAKSIQQEFQAKHFYLENVKKFQVSEKFQTILNGLVYQANRDLEGQKQEPVYLTDDVVDLRRFVAVQKVRVAPEPNLFVALAGQNRRVMLQHTDNFRAQIPDKEAFGRQFTEEIERIRKVLDTYPKLRYDFQGMVDLYGKFYFLDMDGMHHVRKPHGRQELRRIRMNQNGKLQETHDMLTK